MLVDSHCHLDFEEYEKDLDEIIQEAKNAGISAMLNTVSDMNKLDIALEISNKYPFIYTSIGVHPNNAGEFENITAYDIISKSNHKKIVAIGECGLDYHYENFPREIQKKVFIEHIKASQETGLPLIIHNRDSDDDMLEILEKYYEQKPFTAQLHCFSSSKKLCDFAISRGFYLSASGVITFNTSSALREIFEEIPLKNLLIETDSPFLAPVPKRGRRNQPSYIKYTAEKLAQIKNVTFEEIADITTENFYKLFRKASDKGRYKF